MTQLKHLILGIPPKYNGVFDHSFNLALNLYKKRFDVLFISHWFNSPIKEINILTGNTHEVNINQLKNDGKSLIYLQTHTYEYNGLIDGLKMGPMIYTMHSIIPYFYMNTKKRKELFEGKLSDKEIKKIKAEGYRNEREKAQMSAAEKSDAIITISKTYKKVLELFKIKKPIYVLENTSEFAGLDSQFISKITEKSNLMRDKFKHDNIILHCGNLYPGKGATRLFKAFKEIRKNYSAMLVLLGISKRRTQQMISYGLDERLIKDVLFVSPISKKNNIGDLVQYYLASDLIIQPVITKVLYSKSTLDGMAVGKPVISCKSDYTIGSSETEKTIFNSFVFFKGNPEEVELVTNKAKEKVMEENTWKAYIPKLERIIKTFQ